MKKKQKFIALALIAFVLIVGAAVYALSGRKDGCTQHDKDINNCVPVGRCTPPGTSDATIDCDNSHEHRFNLDR